MEERNFKCQKPKYLKFCSEILTLADNYIKNKTIEIKILIYQYLCVS